MEREREQLLYRLQAELCQTLADPTLLELLSLLGDGPKAVKDLVALLGQRQANERQQRYCDLSELRRRRCAQAHFDLRRSPERDIDR